MEAQHDGATAPTSTVAAPNNASKRPRMPKRARLFSAKDPSIGRDPENLARMERERSASRSAQPAQPSQPTENPPPAKTITKCPGCQNPNIQESDGTKVCMSCGTMINESNIVSEVTFGESAAGAAVVQGGFVGQGQRHAKTLGGNYKRMGVSEGKEVAENLGREELRKQANALGLPESIFEAAFNVYKYAASLNFIQGRRIRNVAAVCLYVACRRDRSNTILLVDFSELLHVNVFKLGAVYQDMKNGLWLHEYEKSGVGPVIQPEMLIERYCKKLEFGTLLYKVADDAVKILKRMKRDWMVTGRVPSGLCGACIILAARMNNFRRSVREVVFVVKVADLTISKRMEEFQRTESSRLSVKDFREIGHRMKDKALPPSVYLQDEDGKLIRKRKRDQPKDTEPTDIIEVVEVNNVVDSTTVENPRPRQKRLRKDADGFAIPAVPVDPALSATSQEKSKRGRKRKAPQSDQTSTQNSQSNEDIVPNNASNQSPDDEQDSTSASDPPSKKKKRSKKADESILPLTITEDDLMAEDELEAEIDEILNDPESIANMEEAKYNKYREQATELAENQRAKDAEKGQQQKDPRSVDSEPHDESSDRNNGVSQQANYPTPSPTQVTSSSAAKPSSVSSTKRTKITHTHDLDDPKLGADEFADDPEIAACILTHEESNIKERIWTTHNEDWIRQKNAKMLRKELDEAHGIVKKTRAKPKKGRKSRMGDGSVLEGEEGEGPVTTPEEAVRRMMKKHAAPGFSKHIDYDRLAEVYGGLSKRAGSATATSVATTALTDSVLGDDADDRASEAPTESTNASSRPSGIIVQSREVTRKKPGRKPSKATSTISGISIADSPTSTQLTRAAGRSGKNAPNLTNARFRKAISADEAATVAGTSSSLSEARVKANNANANASQPVSIQAAGGAVYHQPILRPSSSTGAASEQGTHDVASEEDLSNDDYQDSFVSDPDAEEGDGFEDDDVGRRNARNVLGRMEDDEFEDEFDD